MVAATHTLNTGAPAVATAITRPATAVRRDIQALRAIAVSLVLIYHLIPNRLTGGFVGVDVFFVISGFLITAHLLGRPPRSARQVAAFWSRRVRRLLPAALVVLATTLVAARLFAPETLWRDTARQTIASALYAENWVLAVDSIDYLASDNTPTPVQHFWSLSVEEQFYFVWPVLIALLVAWGARWSRRWILFAGLALVAAGSLGYSVYATLHNPAAAYFVTPARAWEFALGGLLAVVSSSWIAVGTHRPRQLAMSPTARRLLAAGGLIAIVLSALLYDPATPFPGTAALLPTLGAVAVIAAQPDRDDGIIGATLAIRPMQWLGDVSYSLYLWHWPLIVLVPYVSGGRLGMLDVAVIAVVALILAGLTKWLVEDRFRVPLGGASLGATFLAAAAAMAVVVALAAVQLWELDRRGEVAQARLQQALTGSDPCLGAGARQNWEICRDDPPVGVVPAPAEAERDKSAAYPDVSGGRDCWSAGPDFPVVRCQFGSSSGTRRVALIGNSHAGQWLPALERVAEQDGWQISTFLASRCAMVPIDQNLPTAASTESCRRWVNDVATKVAREDYDLVIVTNRMSVTASGADGPQGSEQRYQGGYEDLFRGWSAAGVRVLALRDTPAPGDGGIPSMPECVAANADDLSACAGRPADWLPPEPMIPAADAVGSARITVRDFTDLICEPDRCAGVVGGVLVYFDGSHLTATYARTLAPALRQAMADALAG